MAIIDSFKANATSVEFSWPAELTGLERIMLSARGELQRLLSAFFSHTINIKTIYEHTSPHTHTASPEEPITQRREVHLLCGGKTACIATSDTVVSRSKTARNTLWRRYTLSTEGFVCDITEVFPDRDMFKLCEQWLDEESVNAPETRSGEQRAPARYAETPVSRALSRNRVEAGTAGADNFGSVVVPAPADVEDETSLRRRKNEHPSTKQV
ncbi:hypothetical protein H4582DRAFT_2130456 [Lactarius indigo]|nr:hypothetical protein H4582DRAFT_2130456 [Lactarius indigo]